MAIPYYTFMAGHAACPACDWTGPARQTRQLELLDFGTEQGCPACGETIAFTEFPLAEDAACDPTIPADDRAMAQLSLTHRARREASELAHPDQLPTLDPPPHALTWDAAGAGLDEEWVIRHGEVEVWRELAGYEAFDRAATVMGLLQQRYPTLRHVEFTPAAQYGIYGDALYAPGFIDACNRRLAEGRPVLATSAHVADADGPARMT